MDPLSRELLTASIHAAFDDVPVPSADDILAPEMQRSIDPLEMRAALAGKHWSVIPMEDLTFHREAIFALGPVGFPAYIAAFLLAALAEDRMSPDIFDYTLFALYPIDDAEVEVVRRRLSRLTPDQRMAIVEWLRYFADRVA
jgi:hypothetical protein